MTVTIDDLQKIRRLQGSAARTLRAAEWTIEKIATALGISPGSVARAIAADPKLRQAAREH